MRPLNNNLVCKDLTDDSSESTSGFIIRKAERFKTLEVINSSEPDILVGDKVRVSINSGEDDGENVIIRRADVIYIL